ncbi:TraB family protein [Salinivirga cyanobacteriivorans]|uniref:TraB family protein n=1 Tax=Salinivirga cyanobacteriivorans TaxID=1307839 RepID=A0A0S2I2L7_9BACT|nr:TraB/GumN family protein [Salinivirga cyanobacteriivorans]ALO16458.1 TraB family protein [Salinivirga cyanobacteriivorans]
MTKLVLVISTLGLFFAFDACRMNANVQEEGSSSLLWKVYGNDLKDTSYLYGTIHIQDKRVFEYGETVEKAFQKSDKVAVEVLMDRIDPSTMMDVMFMEDTTLDMLLSEKEYARLEEAYKSITGAGLETANRLKPFFISANMIQSLMPRDMAMPLDMHFIQQARKAEKTVVGLETLDEQIAIIDDLSYTRQMNMLMESIEDVDKMKDQFKELVDAYLNMDKQRVMKLMEDPSLPEDFMDNLLDKRNKLMVARMQPLFKTSGTFVAVGAAHLYGEEGLINMLRQKGYQVEPVKFAFEIED